MEILEARRRHIHHSQGQGRLGWGVIWKVFLEEVTPKWSLTADEGTSQVRWGDGGGVGQGGGRPGWWTVCAACP